MGDKLTILQLTNHIPWPLNDGGNIATFNVTKRLHELGHEVILASFNTSKHFVNPAEFPPVAELYTVNINNDINWKGLLMSFFTRYNYVINRFESKEYNELIINILEKYKPDIVQLEGVYMTLYLDTIRKYSKAKIVLRAHNVESEIWKRLSLNESNFLKKKYLSLLHMQIEQFELKAFEQVDGIVPITERDEEYVKNYFLNQKIEHVQVETINAGVDLDKFQRHKTEVNNKQICFLGSLEWMPNVQGLSWFLKKIWPQVLEQNPDLEIHIAGKNPSLKIEGLEQKGVVFHGQVPDATSFLNEYSIMVVPLLSGGGMRLKIIEALAMKMCVISTSIGAEGINYVPDNNLIIADSEQEFVLKINQLVADKDKIQQISNHALQLSNQYSWDSLIKNLEIFYRKLI